MKVSNFGGELTDIAAKKEPLSMEELSRRETPPAHWGISFSRTEMYQTEKFKSRKKSNLQEQAYRRTGKH